MKLTVLLSIAAVGLFAAVVAIGQSPSPARPSAFQTHLQAERFQIVTSIRGLPLGVRDELHRMFGGGGLDIAEPGAPFQGIEATGKSNLPLRRLIAAGCANDGHCLVYYERGGKPITWRIALFQWTPSKTRMEWGGVAPAGFTTIDDVRKAVASGAIKGGDGAPW
jgi:hypothetical protein